MLYGLRFALRLASWAESREGCARPLIELSGRKDSHANCGGSKPHRSRQRPHSGVRRMGEPGVSEIGVVLDPVECGIDCYELSSYALNDSPYVGSIPIRSGACVKSLVT